jgi:drug/metabolite transporter (DMT)-like permease
MRTAPIALFMLIAAALVYGAIFSVNKIAAAAGWPSLSFAFAQSLGAGIILAVVALLRGEPLRCTRAHAVSYLVIGGLVVALPISLLTYVAPHLPAATMTLVLALSPGLTFLFAMLFRQERFRLLGLLGVAVGFAGMLLLVSSGSELTASGAVGWFLLALLAPVMFALSNVMAALLRPPATGSLGMAAGVLLGSAVVLLPLLALFGRPLLPPDGAAALVPALAAIAINATFFVLFFEIIRRAGATFFSQFNYLAVLAGVGWGAVLFGERPGLMFWVALAVMLIGVHLSLTAAQTARRAAQPSG